MKDAQGEILYVGKAANLKRRVSSYFTRPHEYRIEKLVSRIAKIERRDTDTAIEALILESQLIKELQPPFNVLEKDDKSFLYVLITTKEKFPRVLTVRGKEADLAKNGKLFGPFTSGYAVRESLRILRRIFPWNMHAPEEKYIRPCFNYQIGLCPGVCAGAISWEDYHAQMRNLVLFFEGKKKLVLRSLKTQMIQEAKAQEYEKADQMKRQIFNLEHIQDVALIFENEVADPEGHKGLRIEGYDISNISGTSAVGSMVVFTNGKPDKAEYRKFKIKTIEGANDTAMIHEVLTRRLRNNWPLPNLFLIDGGLGQVNAARAALKEAGLRIPVVGIMKGPERKRNDFIGSLPPGFPKGVLVRVRDEAHRFAIRYHKQVRGREFFAHA